MRISREAAVKAVGEDSVSTVEIGNVDYTNRVTDGTNHFGSTEFACSVEAVDSEGEERTLTMYVFVDTEKLDGVESLEDIDWGAVIENTAEFEIN